MVLFAIRYHDEHNIDFDYTNLNNEDQKIAVLMAKAIRDVITIRDVNNIIYANSNVEINKNSIPWSFIGLPNLENLKKEELSHLVKECMIHGQLVNRIYIKTYSDALVYVLSKLQDLNFDYTKGKINKWGVLSNCLDLMRNNGASEEDIQFVEKIMTRQHNADEVVQVFPAGLQM